MSRVTLVSPPWRIYDASCPALGVLAPLLEAHGLDVEVLYGSLLMPPGQLSHHFLASYAAHLFVPHLYDGVERSDVVDTVSSRTLADFNLQGLLVPPEQAELQTFGLDPAQLEAALLEAIDAAGLCIEACVDAMVQTSPHVVGFSVTFETQLTGALAIARRLRLSHPEIAIMMGGPACFAPIGAGLLEAFPTLIDAVCLGEGEAVIGPLAQALARGESLSEVPGIAWRKPSGSVIRNPSPPLFRDLDSVPLPDHRAFVEQLERSPWSEHAPRLYFELSRGCWWGEKNHCTFCGLNADAMTYRKKSPSRAVEEVRELYTRYPTARRLECTDNILDMGYLRTVLPELERIEREPERPLRIFFEVKSNLTREQLASLSRAGIDYIQPGIESLSDGVLKLMKKGCTALGQVQFLKWASELQFYLAYYILIGSPGEETAWYHTMAELIQRVMHLPPPMGVSPIWLERYSPYHTDPERYGLSNLRPRPHYASLYRSPTANLEKLAYVFDFDHPMHDNRELAEAHRTVVGLVQHWQQAHPHLRGSVFYTEHNEGGIVLIDRRGEAEQRVELEGSEAALFRLLDKHRPRPALGRHLPDLTDASIDALLEHWQEEAWVVWDPDAERFLSVVPRHQS